MPLAERSLLLDVMAVDGGGFVAVGERGHVIVSPDGQSWTQAESVPTRSTLTSVTGKGSRLWAAGHDSIIITSRDGGTTWTRQFFDPERRQPIMDIHFFDEQRGMAVGAYGLALFTRDGGRNWDDGIVNEDEWHNNALAVNDDALLVAAEAGMSYRSLDDGESWEPIEMPYPGSMFGAISNSDQCFVVFGLRGNVQESCDSGDSWEELDSGTQSSIMGGIHQDGLSVLVGKSGLVLLRDSDGEFQVSSHSSGVDFSSVAHLGGRRFVLVGEDGVHYWPEVDMELAP